MRLIDADALKREFPKDEDWDYPTNTNGYVCAVIDAAPTIEPERKKGYWFFSSTDFLTHCSNCGQSEWKGYCPTPEEATKWMPICPKCGAEMKGEDDE